MFAIFGVIGRSDAATVVRMGERLAHRGREVRITSLSDGVTLGVVGPAPERALAVRGSTAVVSAARIQNLDDLAAGLPSRETPSSEAELILALYRSGGAEAVSRIDGEFAFVLVDSRRDEVVLGRDYFGMMPLYHTSLPSGGIAFASEYKALLALPEVDGTPDRNMLQYLQHAKKLPVGRTLLESIRAVLPGAVIRIARGSDPVTSSLSQPLEVRDVIEDEAEATPMLREALFDSLRRKADDLDPVGLALSGGIDSVGLAFALRRLYPDRTIHTFTAGHGPGDPELDTAAAVSEAIGSVHHEVFTGPALLTQELPDLVWHLEDPFARSEVLQLYEIGRAARDHVDVVLSGQGSDSLFGGMPRYRLLDLLDRLPFLRGSLAEFYDLATNGIPPQRPLSRLMRRLYFGHGITPVPEIRGSDYAAPRKTLTGFGPEFVNRAMAEGYQVGQAADTIKYERSFAAWGLGYRSPYVDEKLARVAFRISDSLKLKGLSDKYVLRRAFEPLVPAPLYARRKRAQRMLCDERFSHTLDRVADAVLTPGSVEARGFMDCDQIAALRSRPDGAPYHYESAMRLWTAILTELWGQEFLDRRGAGPCASVCEEAEPRRA
ncbi:MAG: asparagine synthase-related protein [Gemmatimonadota bacterium]|nr:asparagine synthase-related protein [Gemmatimonadota bacterium]